MSDIDWSKAPEGATHWFSPFFYKAGVDACFYWSGSSGWKQSSYKRLPPNAISNYSATWTGTGLPPVGTVCEYNASSRHEHGEELWCGVQIKYRSDWVIVFECVSAPAGHEGSVGVELFGDVSQGLEKRFRHIRTPEQIAAEERAKEIGRIERILSKETGMADSNRHRAAVLYDEGLRFKEAP